MSTIDKERKHLGWGSPLTPLTELAYKQRSRRLGVWLQAQEVFDSFAPKLTYSHTYSNFSGFRMKIEWRPHYGSSIRIRNDENQSFVYYYFNLDPGNFSKKLEEMCLEDGGVSFRWNEHGVKYKIRESFPFTSEVPDMEFFWKSGSVDPRSKGRLDQLGFYSRKNDMPTLVYDCEYMRGWDIKDIIAAFATHKGKGGVVPDGFKGIGQILGYKNPWQVDYDAIATQVLRESRLREVADAVNSKLGRKG